MIWTEKRYKDAFFKKFKIPCTLAEPFPIDILKKSPLKHQCTECSEIYTSSISSQLSISRKFSVCLKCSYKKRRVLLSTSESTYKKKLRKKFDYIKCIKYSGSKARKSEFKCECGNTWKAASREVLSAKIGCPECAKNFIGPTRLTIEDIKKRIAHKPNISILSTDRHYIGNRITSRIDVGCSICNHKWNVYINTLTDTPSGCPNCAKIKALNVASKVITLNGKPVIIQGYEEYAIEFLKRLGIKEEKIQVFSEWQVPIIPYKFQNRFHEYWPDIKLGKKLLIEVKSIYTLCFDLEKNKAKAKACISLGYKHKLFLVSNTKVYVLPDDWLSWREEDVKKFLRRKTLKKMRILAFDPGSTNFAWSVLEVKRPFKVKLLATGMIRDTLKSLTGNIKPQVDAFIFEIQNLFTEYNIDHVIAERFMHRPGIKGLTMELVNQMLGFMLCAWDDYRRLKDSSKLLTAAQWKNEWNRYSDLKDFYSKVNCTVHQVDSIGIGLYGASYWFDEKPFIDIKKLEKSLIKQIDSVNLASQKK